jgi:hypothetical protein
MAMSGRRLRRSVLVSDSDMSSKAMVAFEVVV